jgi:hypothetical protein
MDSTKIYSKCSSDFDIIPTESETCITSSNTTTGDNQASDTTTGNNTVVGDTTVCDTTTCDNQASDTTTGDNTVVGDTTVCDTTTGDTTVCDTTTGDTTTGDTTTGDTTTGDTTTGDTTTGDTTTGDTTTGDTTTGDTTTGDTTTGDTTTGDNLNSQSDLYYNTFNFIKDSDVYIVSVDGCPKFYVNTEKAAYDKMWEVTRLLSSKYVFDGYRTQYIKVKNNELHILGSYRFFIVAYDQILNRITYNKIYQCL